MKSKKILYFFRLSKSKTEVAARSEIIPTEKMIPLVGWS